MAKKIVFEWFPQYRFLETEIMNYPILYRDFMNYEKTRKLLLYYLTEQKRTSDAACTFLFIKYTILTPCPCRYFNEKKSTYRICKREEIEAC